MTCGCSGVEWGWGEYKTFESQVGGTEWLERMEEEVEPRYLHSRSCWQERGEKENQHTHRENN